MLYSGSGEWEAFFFMHISNEWDNNFCSKTGEDISPNQIIEIRRRFFKEKLLRIWIMKDKSYVLAELNSNFQVEK